MLLELYGHIMAIGGPAEGGLHQAKAEQLVVWNFHWHQYANPHLHPLVRLHMPHHPDISFHSYQDDGFP